MILVDTQVAYWSMAGVGSVGRQALAALEAAPQRFVSSVSHVEFVIKQMRGKLRLPDDLPARLAEIGFEALPFTEVHAHGMSMFPSLAGHDPFDRMLVAQARSENLELLTSDRVLLSLGFPWIRDATR